jgi:hypothetical protein
MNAKSPEAFLCIPVLGADMNDIEGVAAEPSVSSIPFESKVVELIPPVTKPIVSVVGL